MPGLPLNAEIFNIQSKKLSQRAYLKLLFDQAVRLKLVEQSERGKLQFYALACHACRVGSKPGPLLASNLYHARWDVIAHIDEDEAGHILKATPATRRTPKVNYRK